MVEIELYGEQATVRENGVWESSDPGLATLLNSLPPVTGYDPDLAATLANRAKVRFGAKIISQTDSTYVAGRVY